MSMMIPDGYGGNPYAGVSPRSAMNDRRLDEVRHKIFKFLAISWRPKEDSRDSHCEIIHVKSGTPIGSLSIPDKDRPEHVADWIMETASNFLRGSGDSGHAQNFNILFDEARHSFWIYPDGGDEAAGGMESAIQEQRLRHHETMHLQYTDATDKVLGHLGKVIEVLSKESTEKSEALAKMAADQTAQMNMYRDLMGKVHEHDLEVMRATKSEERKQLVTDRFLTVVDQAVQVGAPLAIKKIAEKISSGSDLEQLANHLGEADTEKLRDLIRAASAKAKELKAAATDRAEAAPAAPAAAAATAAAPAATEAPPAATEAPPAAALQTEKTPPSAPVDDLFDFS